MAGFIFVLIAMGGAALYASIQLNRRFLDMLPLSMLLMILSAYVFGLFGWMHIGVYVTVFAYAGLGIAGLYLAVKRRSGWKAALKRFDISLLLLLLCLIWIAYISVGRIPLKDDELTAWALVPKMLFYDHGFSAAAGQSMRLAAVSMAVFQSCFQTVNSLFTGGGFTDWLLYAAYGAACAVLLVPFCRASHTKRTVGFGYTALFFLVLLTFALDRFAIFSELPVDGFAALLAAYAVVNAVKPRQRPHAVLLGIPIAVLALSGITGLYLAIGTAAVCTVLFLKDKKRDALPAALVWILLLAAAATWLLALKPAVSGAGLHLNNWEVFAGFWRLFASAGYYHTVSVPLPNVITINFFSVTMSYFALMVLYAIVSGWLIAKTRQAGDGSIARHGTAVLWTAVLCVVFVIGLCLFYMLVPAQADAVTLPDFGRNMNVILGFWGAVLLFSLLGYRRQIKPWTNRQHILLPLVCAAMIFMYGGSLATLTSRDFTEDAQTHASYYSILGPAKEIMPEDASVYIVSQNDTGSRYYTLRYGLYPRRANAANTWWLTSPDRLSSAVMHAATREQWQEAYLQYDYVLVYALDAYFSQTMVSCFENEDAMRSGGIYRVDQASGLLVPAQ